MTPFITTIVATFLAVAQPYAKQHDVGLSVPQTKCLAEAVYFESRGESVAGNEGVAYVALNRAALEHKTICSVVHEPGQFSYYHPRTYEPIREPDAWVRAVYVAVLAQLGLIHNPIGDATMYNNHRMPRWQSKSSTVTKVDHHYFYTRKDTPPGILPHVTGDAANVLIICLRNIADAQPIREEVVSFVHGGVMQSHADNQTRPSQDYILPCGVVAATTITQPSALIHHTLHATSRRRSRSERYPLRRWSEPRRVDHPSRKRIPQPSTRHYRRH